jgi:hypothetical protein
MMSSAALPVQRVHNFHPWTKDIGVAIVVAIALLGALVLRGQVEGRTATFQDKSSGFSMSYPATWGSASTLKELLVKVEDQRTDSAFKTSLSVEKRGLDTQSPPTLQQLVDRRVAQQGTLTAFHLLSSREETVAGAKAMRQEYAYVVQPIDQTRRDSVPVVVHAVDYIVVTKNNAFYITLAAPDSSFDGASNTMNDIIRSVKLQ